MAAALTQVWGSLKHGGQNSLGAPILLLALIGMVVVPLPPIMLDMFFTFNIAMSITILLAVIYVLRPLDFSVFPTVLLTVTLLRLALNVASTRVVLLNGHTGPGAAGRVIQSFGDFVIGGNYAVGLVVFGILTIINFVVVTKGAERISEVTARFTLDAMPGKQMAIDADLNAGVLSNEEARDRREEVRREADFYGSMDGASKFVRGDALAGILILFINIIGGLIIGTASHDMALGEAGRVYTLLTIGDGLVAQIPSLMLSTAVAILVTRVSDKQEIGSQIFRQMFKSPQALTVTAGILLLMGMIPGMPNLPFLMLGVVAAAGAYWLYTKRTLEAEATAVEQAPAAEPVPAEARELGWEDVMPDEPLGLEVGYRLIPLVDSRQGGELMARIKGVRKKLTQELGFLIQPVHIRDNLELAPNAYRVTLFGAMVASGEIQLDRELALSSGRSHGKLDGIPGKDPVFGLDAYWIEPGQRGHAQSLGYTVVDPATVIATHLSHVIKLHAHELLGHDEAQNLVDNLSRQAPRLVEDLVPKVLPLSAVVRVLQNLLQESVPIKNLRAIFEAMAETAQRSTDPAHLTANVRVALGRQIVQGIFGPADELQVLTLSSPLEQMLQDSGGGEVLEPGLAQKMQDSLVAEYEKAAGAGRPAVLLVPSLLRDQLARFVRHSLPGLHVLAYNEVPENKRIQVVGAVG